MRFQTKGFATIRISSPNVAKSRAWYKQLFDAEPVEDIDGFTSFRINGVCFDIAAADAKSPVSTGGSVGYWLVDNLELAIDNALELGGIVYRGPMRVNEIRRTIVQIKDPFGGVIGFEADF